jgi:hypothetical protein
VTVADGFLAGGVLADDSDGEVDFSETAAGGGDHL